MLGASSFDIVVLNASGFPLEVIVSALNNLRIGLYTRPDWPLAFLLVVDGASVYEFASILSECFYIQPHRVRGKALDDLIKRMMWKVRISPFFRTRRYCFSCLAAYKSGVDSDFIVGINGLVDRRRCAA